MTESAAEPSKKSAWNILFWAVVLVGGFFTLLGPCLYFRGFTESDPEYQFLRTYESPDGSYFADVFRYTPPDKEGEEAIVVELRSEASERGKGRRIFVSDPDLYLGTRWLAAKNVEISYKLGETGRKPDRMVWEALGVEVSFR